MHFVETVDYPNRRIYLSINTVDATIDTIDIYKEVREMRRLEESHRKFPPMIIAGGNIEKIAGVSYTAAYVQLLRGCRIVPYNVSHALKIVRDTFTDDGFSGRECFDRLPLSETTHVDIDFEVSQVEIRVIYSGGSALTQQEHDRLFALPQFTVGVDSVLTQEEHDSVTASVPLVKDGWTAIVPRVYTGS
jgi:hypothetical protein